MRRTQQRPGFCDVHFTPETCRGFRPEACPLRANNCLPPKLVLSTDSTLTEVG